MRRKKLISPEQPTQDIVKYKFKLLFLPYLSYCIGISVLGAFFFGIIYLILLVPLTIAIAKSILLFVCSLAIQVIVAYILIKISNFIITPVGVSGLNLLGRRISMNWQEIALIKPYRILGMRCLSIKTASGKNIQLATHLHETAKILDRVRELAGTEHILVRALEKELSRPRYELSKLWVGVIGAIGLTMSIYLIGGNMYAAEQEKPFEQAIATYVRQHPKTAPNESAIELQSLMTKLGLSIDVFGDGSEVKVKPTIAAIAEWKSIERPLQDYVNQQLEKNEDSIAPVPDKVLTYLNNHQADLEAVVTYLANNPIPEWGNNSWTSQSNLSLESSSLFSKLPIFLSTTNIESLTTANLLDKQQQPNADLTKHLIVFDKIQQSVRSQKSLIGQLYSLIGQGRISRLVRQIDSRQAALNQQLSQGWGNNLFGQERHKYMASAIENESITANKLLQNPALFDRLLVTYDSPLRWIPGFSYLVSPSLRLAAVDRHREVAKGIAYWSQQNICRTNGNSGVKPTIDFAEYTIDPVVITSQYPKVLKQDLLWELTTSVRQVKAKLAAGEKADLVARDFQLQSQVCPGEKWTAKAADGSVNIGFSHPPDWKALGMSNSTKGESLTYTIKPVAKT